MKCYLLRRHGNIKIDEVFDMALEERLIKYYRTRVVSEGLYNAMMKPPRYKRTRKVTAGKFIGRSK